MRLKSTLRTLSLGAATLTFLLAGPAWAQSGGASSQSSAAWLAGGTARLDHPIDAKTAKTGQAVDAKLQGAVKIADGTELPRGTTLTGTIAAVQAPGNGQAASLTLLFDKAQLKDGKTVPVKVTVIGAYPNQENQMAIYGYETMGEAPKQVPAQDRFDQEPGMLSHIAMTSRVSGHNSATFTNQNGDVKLRQGTFLQVGIGSQQNGGLPAGA